MAYRMKRGTKPRFTDLGSSPVKHEDKVNEGSNLDPKHAAAHNKRHAEGDTHGKIGSKDNKWVEKASPTKQTDSTYVGGGKKSKREQDFARRYSTEDKYWYKINNKSVNKAEYLKYKNKPGGDEPGKQTNNPDVYGKKASNFGRGPKTKK